MTRDRRPIRRETPRNLAPLSQRFPALFSAGDSWFDASNYTVDGVSGKVATLVDRIDPTHALVQATSARQVAVPAPHSGFGGALSATFAGGQVYQSNRAASAWNYCHTGPATVVVVLQPTVAGGTQIVLESGPTGTNGLGIFFAGAPAYQQFIFRGGIGGASPLNISTGTVPTTPCYVESYVSDPTTPQRSIKRNGQAALTGAVAGGVSGTADQSMVLGGRMAGTNFLQARWRAVYSFARLLSAAELSVLRAWIAADAGLAG